MHVSASLLLWWLYDHDTAWCMLSHLQKFLPTSETILLGSPYSENITLHVFIRLSALKPSTSGGGRVWFAATHTQELTHVTNNVAHEVQTMVTQEPAQGAKDQDVTLIQKLGNCLCSLVRGHIDHKMLHEMVLEHQDIGDLRWSVWLHGHLNASKVYT